MATGIVITVAANLLAKLHSEELREICSMSGYESELDDLKVRVSTIKSILLDVETKLEELTQRDLDFIPKLKKAVYLFDDVVDEFNTNIVLKNYHTKGGNISKEVGQFFAFSVHFLVSFDMSVRTEQLRNNNDSSCDMANYRQMEFLRTNHVTELNIQFSDQGAIHETLLDRLQPHIRLKGIQIESYEALKLPGWAESLSSSLPNLVKIHLVKFDSLEILPSLSELHHLKYLKLRAISNVEFMENDAVGPSNDELLFFPSLEKLELSKFPKLKGWWRDGRRRVAGEVGSSSMVVPTFSSLRELILIDCPSLTRLPSCPSLRHLTVLRCHEALTFLENNEAVHQGPTSSSSSSIPLLEMYNLTLDNVEAFHYLFEETHEGIWSLWIKGFEGNNLSTLAKKCVRCVSILKELKFLVIWDCPKLMSLSGALKQLTSLQGLTIGKCENLELENNEEQATMMSWKSLHLLSFLRLHDLPKLVYLPQEFQYLTSLRSLSAFTCKNLEALPEWISCLTSLQTLTIWRCDKLESLPEAIAHMPALNTLEIRKCEILERRCREPDGEDWPKVRHIRFKYYSS